MAIPKRPERPAPQNESQIMALIDKGGSHSKSKSAHPKANNFPFRFLNATVRHRVEEAIKRRTVEPSINDWINEAILEKLKAEEAALKHAK